MKKGIINVFIFAAGVAFGSAVTWKFAKAKYEQIANEEIESVKAVYSRKFEPETFEPEEFEPIDDDSLATTIEEANQYIDEIERCGYSTAVDINKERRGKPMIIEGPYVISPEEFDELDGYEAVSLTYYNDGVVANIFDTEYDEDEIEEMIGKDFATHFGEYEKDTVFIRNDELRADYEITRDYRDFRQVVSGDDPDREDE